MSFNAKQKQQYVQGSESTGATIMSATNETAIATLTTPGDARNLIGVMAGLGETGAYTAAEPIYALFSADSTAVDLVPKQFTPAPLLSGLGVAPAVMAPALVVTPFNVPLIGGEQITYSCTPFTDSTVEPDAFMTVKYSNRAPNPQTEPQVYWQGPTNETATGTTLANGIVGGTFTISGGASQAILRYLYTILVHGTVTASESYYGNGYVTSDGFKSAMPVEGLAQTIGTALGTAIGVISDGVPIHDQWMPMNSNSLIKTFFDQYESLTAAGATWTGIGYLRVN